MLRRIKITFEYCTSIIHGRVISILSKLYFFSLARLIVLIFQDGVICFVFAILKRIYSKYYVSIIFAI